MKVAVFKTTNHLGIPSDVLVAGSVPETFQHRCSTLEMAGRNHGSRTHDCRVHHGARRAQLYSGPTRWRDHQHWSPVLHETVGTWGFRFLVLFILSVVKVKLHSHRSNEKLYFNNKSQKHYRYPRNITKEIFEFYLRFFVTRNL